MNRVIRFFGLPLSPLPIKHELLFRLPGDGSVLAVNVVVDDEPPPPGWVMIPAGDLKKIGLYLEV